MRNKPPRDKLGELERLEIVAIASKTLYEENGREALNYLKNKRHLNDEIITKFELGYVPSWVKNTFDDPHELAGRIIMPIRNHYGDLIAISTRNWRENASSRGFWHESFEKSHFLYGLNISKDGILKNKKAIVVEGEIDTMSMHRIGFDYTVGMLGSVLSLYQISLLSRYCQEIFLAFDSDTAGSLAIEKAMELYREKKLDFRGISLVPVIFPTPDEICVPEEKKVDADLYANVMGKKSFIELFKKSRLNVNNRK